MNILLGLIGVAIGAAFVIKSETLLSMFGRIAFFEKHLGLDGGSRLGYKLLGIFIAMMGMMIMTGLFQGFMMFFLGPIINAGKR
ncbi:MAG: hypothetical protein NT091_00975 [Candidatus Falkowbacteria bacterium]|nr:hypothetical protein [Candidatus Falkowbacteria bacterium]